MAFAAAAVQFQLSNIVLQRTRSSSQLVFSKEALKHAVHDLPDWYSSGCWTQWFDRDNPSGTGDWETLSSLLKANPGKICTQPIGVEAKTLSGLTAAAAGDVIYRSDTTSGFICRNKDQPKKKWCNDYRVRFSCPPSFCNPGCWTQWFDRDNPSGTGDWETLSSLLKANPGKICTQPIGVEAKTLSGLTAAAAGDVIFK
ncbi:cartilage intermediate layer protein 2-like [Centropristis striata]|uniref:cartilage intermediate layer protein 2-like n=1 Tax=Centropristis striata TaxID=184440 RepID=UPI0027E1869F|nr:cartilage intermediate layer protein 2-like [Centropristis striata]